MSATTRSGSQGRQTLAWQIDRLDGILDGLAAGLDDAVGAAVCRTVAEAVRGAVKAAVTEVLRDAELQRQLHLAGPVVPVEAPTARLPRCTTGGAALAAAGLAPWARSASREAVRLAARGLPAAWAGLAAA